MLVPPALESSLDGLCCELHQGGRTIAARLIRRAVPTGRPREVLVTGLDICVLVHAEDGPVTAHVTLGSVLVTDCELAIREPMPESGTWELRVRDLVLVLLLHPPPGG